MLRLFENLVNLVLMKTWVSEDQWERPSDTCLLSLWLFIFMVPIIPQQKKTKYRNDIEKKDIENKKDIEMMLRKDRVTPQLIREEMLV